MTTPLQIACFVDPMFGENAYVLWRRDGGPCWILDPGLPPSPEQMIEHIRDRNLIPDSLLLTHGHADHIAGVPTILDAFPALTLRASLETQEALRNPRENLSSGMGMAIRMDAPNQLDLPAGGRLALDELEWTILDVSGHAPGSRAIYSREAGVVFVGDALFHSSIGRTDFPHSDHATLLRNIRENLLTLPEDTKVYSGHGPVTTIGREKRLNPWLQ